MFNYAFGLHFGVKISKWYSNFEKSQNGPLFYWNVSRFPFPLSQGWREGVPRVSSSIFWIFLLLFFWIFLLFLIFFWIF